MSLKVNQGKLDWTSELVARLRDLWDQGVPTAKIARLLGPTVTKNMVIGKAHRLRLPMRKLPIGTHPRGVERSTKHYAKKPRPSRAKAPPGASLPLPVPEPPPLPPKPPPAPPPAPPKPIPPRQRQGTYTLLDLRHGECKWPVNSPERGGTYLFCGEPQFNGWSYCEYHSRVGYAGTKRQASTAGWQPRQAGF